MDTSSIPAQQELNAALIEACKQNNIEEACRLLHAGAEPDCRDKDFYRPLQHAAQNGYCELIRVLVEHGAALFIDGYYEWDAVQLAISENQFDALKLMLELGVDIHSADLDGWTLLHIAVNEENPIYVRYLLEHGADVNRADEDGRTALHLAAFDGNFELIQLLLKHGAYVNPVAIERDDANRRCFTPLDVVQYFKIAKNPVIINILREHGALCASELPKGMLPPYEIAKQS